MKNTFPQHSGPALIEKVVAYVTRGDRLLVFRHVDVDAGIQVPAGTLEPGESPSEGVLREAREETGIHSLQIVRFLGARDYDMSDHGNDEIHRRYHYHLKCVEDTPEVWRHFESDPTGRSQERIEFELYWVQLPDEVPGLAAPQGDFLPELLESLLSSD
ncbi:MAG: NUDIX domain-containing protein [Chloroflexota bacterium]|nr:NUDIX domain-containing protein [Chloroflexota bacterium]